MWPVFADPKTDFVFKRIFGAEDRKHLLIGLLNALLELDEAHRIVEVQHLPVQDARGALTIAERKGRQEGRLEEKRAVLQKLLSAKDLSEAHRARISACEDAAELDGSIDRATPAELFGSS